MTAGHSGKRGWIAWVGLAFALALSAQVQPAAGPIIERVDPPNWWIGLPDPMVMFTGENLGNASVTSFSPHINVRRTMQGRNGHYLFAWLHIDKNAPPQELSLLIATSGGRKSIRWKLERRNPAGKAGEANQGFNGFGPDDVIYLIMPDRFADGDPLNNFVASGAYDRSNPRAYHGGDFRGIQEHLPYLKDLGVTTIWITPIYDNEDHTGRDYHGYGATDLYKIEEHFGRITEYQSLVSAAHQQGFKVILDIVPNHIGPANPWVDDPPTDHWLHGTRTNHLTANAEFQHLVDPHASPPEKRNIVEGWFAGVLPDMGTDDPVTSQFLRQNAIWWAETGALDGFRLDTFPYVDRQFWHNFHADLHTSYPRFRTVGEVSGFDPVIASYFAGGKARDGVDSGVDTLFDFSLYHALHQVILHDAPASSMETVLRNDWLFPHPEWLVTFLGNHDTQRFMGEPGATPQKLTLAFALLLTMRGIPQIYAGDEIGMAGNEDPDNRHDFPGGFPGDSRNAFTQAGRTADEQKVFQSFRDLLHLRAQHPALRRGQYLHIFSDDRTFVYLRASQPQFPRSGERPERLLMFMNNADQSQRVNIALQDTILAPIKKLTRLWADQDVSLMGGTISVELPPRSLSIYRVE